MGRWGQRVPSSAPTPCPVAHLEGANPSRAPGLRSAPSCPCCCGQAGTFRAQPDREIHSIFWFQSYRLSCPPLATGHHGCTLVSGDPSWPSLLPLRPVQQAEFRPMLPYLDSQFVRSPLRWSLGSAPSPWPRVQSRPQLATAPGGVPAVRLLSLTVPAAPRGRQMGDEARTDSSSFSRPPRPSFCLKPGLSRLRCSGGSRAASGQVRGGGGVFPKCPREPGSSSAAPLSSPRQRALLAGRELGTLTLAGGPGEGLGVDAACSLLSPRPGEPAAVFTGIGSWTAGVCRVRSGVVVLSPLGRLWAVRCHGEARGSETARLCCAPAGVLSE